MIKSLLSIVLAVFVTVASASIDVNKASRAELETIKGIGPAVAGRMLDERSKSAFKDWPDLMTRVKGVGEGNAAKFSSEGLTVNGAAFAAAAPAAKPEAKPGKPAKTAPVNEKK